MPSFILVPLAWVAIAGLGALGILVFDAYTDPPRHSVSPESLDPNNPPFIADRETGYRNRPGYQKNKVNQYSLGGESITVITPIFNDSLGARVPSPDLPAPDRVGIVTVGGSQAWGQGVREEQTFSAVLARLMGTSGRNFAIPGTGGVASYFMVRRNLDLKPKWIVYGFWEDHLNRNLRYCSNNGFPFCTPMPRVVLNERGKARFELPENPEEKLGLAREYFRNMRIGEPNSLAWKDVVWAFRRLMRRLDQYINPKAYDKATDDEKIDAAIFVLSNIAQTARSVGARLIVAYIPLYFSEKISPASARFFEAANREDFIFVDTGQALNLLRKNGGAISIKADGHLSVDGHNAIAEDIFRELQKRGHL